MRKINFKRKNVFVLFLLLLVCIIYFAVGGMGGNAYAASSNSSSVKDDLLKDENFNVWDYPHNDKDYSIQVIQIAESESGNLYLYTYQPCQSTTFLLATDINMSLSETVDGTKLYSLTLISSSGVFCKYKVNGVTVSKDATRYYNITSIYRDWIKDIDGETGNDNTTNSVAFSVGRLYRVTTENGVVKYKLDPVYTVDILNPFVGFCRYRDGYDFWGSYMASCDSHYIAFSTEINIDKLTEADVYFTTQSSHHYTGRGTGIAGETTLGDKVENYTTLYYTDVVSNSGDKLFGNKYTWNRIEKTADFVRKEDLNPDVLPYVRDSQWVFRFCETELISRTSGSLAMGTFSVDTYSTLVSSVSILRLKFESGGKTYDLGAVMDMRTGSDEPSNNPENIGFFAYVWRCVVRLFNGTATLFEQIVAVVAIFLVVILLPTLLTILGFAVPAVGKVLLLIVKGVGYAVKYLFIGLWYIITAPVRLIVLIVRKIRGDQ